MTEQRGITRHLARHIFSAILGAALATSLAACGAKTASPTETGNPPFADVERISLGLKSSQVRLIGLPGAVPGGAQVNFSNLTTGKTVQVAASQDGAFEAVVTGTISDEYASEVRTGGGTTKITLPRTSPVTECDGIVHSLQHCTEAFSVCIELQSDLFCGLNPRTNDCLNGTRLESASDCQAADTCTPLEGGDFCEAQKPQCREGFTVGPCGSGVICTQLVRAPEQQVLLTCTRPTDISGSSSVVPPDNTLPLLGSVTPSPPPAQVEANSPLGPRLFEPRSNALVSAVTDEESAQLCAWGVNTNPGWRRDMACVPLATSDAGVLDCAALPEGEGLVLARNSVCRQKLNLKNQCGPLATPPLSGGGSSACCWLFEFACFID
jgi:hypothetical protein